MNRPDITVIIATYNRPYVLRYAILSVLNQSFQNFEILVVGDCCTDDTEDLVKEWNDHRIHFYNLPENCGEQSGPNNYGMYLSKGRYIAFLNHDDMYFPDHLGRMRLQIENSKADLIYSWYCTTSCQASKRIKNAQIGTSFDIQEGYPASTWLFKRQVFDQIGGWNNYRNIYDQPSQDWINRVAKAGFTIVSTNHLSVMAVQSSSQEKSYLMERSYIHESIWQEILECPKQIRNRILEEQIVLFNQITRKPFRAFGLAATASAKRILTIVGVCGRALKTRIIFRKKGGVIDYLRKDRGLVVKKN